tara:strand:- start:24509 stop:24688 length:180 start_codon:yes stop_codon:yes gene_type:complete
MIYDGLRIKEVIEGIRLGRKREAARTIEIELSMEENTINPHSLQEKLREIVFDTYPCPI